MAEQPGKAANSKAGINPKLDMDWRARLQVMRANVDEFFGDIDPETNIMGPLKQDRGIMFHYQPSIFIAYSATYDTATFQGSNYPLHTYMSSMPPTLPIQVPYTVTNQEEGRYLLAMLQFLKVSTKAQFGESAVRSGKFGRPPPVLEFSYLGPHGYDRVPVIVNDVNYIMPNNVDYTPIAHPTVKGTTNEFQSAFVDSASGGGEQSAQGVTYVPNDLEFTITVMPQYSPRRVRRRFNLDQMRQGKNIGFI